MRRLVSATAVVAIMLMGLSTAASAAEECFEVRFSKEYRPASAEEAASMIGVVQHQVTVDVPESMQGLAATISTQATNGHSVHVNNYAIVGTVVITGTEDTADGVKQSSGTLVLGETVSAYYVMGPRAVGEQVPGISITLVSTICAEIPVTTTTTQPETTTTTQPEVTTTTQPETTTTTQPTTTTTGPTTTTVPSTTTVPPVTSPPTLPFTGPTDPMGLAIAGAALVLLGGGMLSSRRLS